MKKHVPIAVSVMLAGYAGTVHAAVLEVTLPAHTEWCARTLLDKELLENPVGLDKAISQAARPILLAAQRAKSKSIGAVYTRPFAFKADGTIELTDNKIAAVMCANVDAALQTDDPTVTVEQVAAVQVLAEICAEADQCVADITTLLKSDAYRLTDEQIGQLPWRHVNSATGENTGQDVIKAFDDKLATPLDAKAGGSSDDAAFSAVAVPKPPAAPPPQPAPQPGPRPQ